MANAKVVLRAPHAYDVDSASLEAALSFDPESEGAQQQFKDESDINVIVARFGLTGELPEVRMPLSGDFTGVSDFHQAMNLVRQAQESFMEIPAHLRARFNNDPGRLINFLENGDNRDEALKLGLIQPPPEKTRDMVQAVDELAAKLAPAAPVPAKG